MDKVLAPWTEQEVENLHRYQVAGNFHPFTCGGTRHRYTTELVPTVQGWECPAPRCTYTQQWAWEFMVNYTE